MKLRHEVKHEINTADISFLRSRLMTVLSYDTHCGDDGKYFIKSLYFDNCYDKALREKQDGVNKREKFRIRYYNNDTNFIRLEKKTKINGLCNKQSCQITKDEVQKILNGDYGFMLKSEDNLIKELYAKMRYQLLRPKCIIAYTRECFVYSPGNVRITLDSDIKGSSNTQDFFKPDLNFLQLYRNTILEVKWDEYLPDIIRRLVSIKSRHGAAFSKYAAVRFF